MAQHPPHMRDLESAPKFSEATTALFAKAFTECEHGAPAQQGWTMKDVVEHSKRHKTLSEAKVLVASARRACSAPVHCASD